ERDANNGIRVKKAEQMNVKKVKKTNKPTSARNAILLEINNKEQLDMIINYLDITKTVYNALILLDNTDEFYECENEGLDLMFYIELLFLHNIIFEDKELQKENIEFEIGHYIMHALKECCLQFFPFILTDKDYSEIYVAWAVWPEANLQLCIWHVLCSLNLQKFVIELVENHLRHHMLLFKSDGTFNTNANEI
ncbi:4653_t:CDS:2, partial [Cetraspora pellucida]